MYVGGGVDKQRSKVIKKKGEMEGNAEGGGHSEKRSNVHLLPSTCVT